MLAMYQLWPNGTKVMAFVYLNNKYYDNISYLSDRTVGNKCGACWVTLHSMLALLVPIW